MRLPLLVVAAGALVAMVASAAAIEVTVGNFANAQVTIGQDVVDANDIIVKPCDCEPVANPGQFKVFRQNGQLVTIHYALIEGTVITTTDGVAIGTILSVQNDGRKQILLVVSVEGGVLGSVTRMNVRRNAFYWTGASAVIETTLADLRSSIGGIGLAA